MATTISPVSGTLYDIVNNTTQVAPPTSTGAWYVARVYLLFCIDVAGIIGNSLCVVVMTRKSLRSSQFALYASVLAVSDTVVLVLNLIRAFVSWSVFQHTMNTCRIVNFVYYCASTFSSWCIVQLTMDRFHAVIRPLEYYDQVHRKRAVIGLVISALLIMGFYSHIIFNSDVSVEYNTCWWLDNFILYFYGWIGYSSLLFHSFLLLL